MLKRSQMTEMHGRDGKLARLQRSYTQGLATVNEREREREREREALR